jgi:peptidoglycan/LPS O-acetylase OafA/YrhL
MEIVISLFLVVCGIQTAIKLVPEIEKSSNNWTLMKKIVIKQFDALVTLFAAFVLFNATFLARLGSGLLWKGSVAKEFVNCRNNWRMNLLTVNNYAKNDSFCIEPSWILSVEFHMVIAGFISLYLLHKFPGARKIIAGFTILISFAFAAASIYVKKLGPVTFISPE